MPDSASQILVIESEEHLSEISRHLEELGHRVSVTHREHEALDLVRRLRVGFVLINVQSKGYDPALLAVRIRALATGPMRIIAFGPDRGSTGEIQLRDAPFDERVSPRLQQSGLARIRAIVGPALPDARHSALVGGVSVLPVAGRSG